MIKHKVSWEMWIRQRESSGCGPGEILSMNSVGPTYEHRRIS
jgi:hypothetical protein